MISPHVCDNRPPQASVMCCADTAQLKLDRPVVVDFCAFCGEPLTQKGRQALQRRLDEMQEHSDKAKFAIAAGSTDDAQLCAVAAASIALGGDHGR